MNCQEFRTHIDEWLDGEIADDTGLRAHAEACAVCAQQLAIERRFRAQLRALGEDVPADSQRNDHLLAPLRAADSRRRHRQWGGFAAAASLVLGVAIGVLWSPWSGQPQPLNAMEAVVLEPNVTQSVQLAFRSPGELKNAEIRLEASDSVEIEGYPGQRELRWTTDLAQGTNTLDLPVRLLGDEGSVVATISYGGGTRSFSVNLRARKMDGANLNRHNANDLLASIATKPQSDPHA